MRSRWEHRSCSVHALPTVRIPENSCFPCSLPSVLWPCCVFVVGSRGCGRPCPALGALVLFLEGFQGISSFSRCSALTRPTRPRSTGGGGPAASPPSDCVQKETRFSAAHSPCKNRGAGDRVGPGMTPKSQPLPQRRGLQDGRTPPLSRPSTWLRTALDTQGPRGWALRPDRSPTGMAQAWPVTHTGLADSRCSQDGVATICSPDRTS